MIVILMMLAKLVANIWSTLFWNKGYDVIIFIQDVIGNILSRDSNYIVDMIIWRCDFLDSILNRVNPF